ncbi:superfamily I DNA/RNA helicase/mRNA-degrading endonuclease RelE of RelBE toxin-antitoxin system [Salinibacter ruber]|uniref:3'-5' exonuclease n=1 Tax=Salinibacter ruber TaxID=146919 RepID=UPI002168A3B4|nr:3'-5' exonuclease [Salinibacter ruber]MCS4181631.1 superfamily I DNA/RNA helicase/mRNA-degrading endonuclease RelE of RelBE toxin-antitoxin system [Salinibacter ruber]
MPDVKVAVSDQFLEAFSQVPKNKQKKVRRFMTKFRQDPTLPGINYETIEGAKDPKLRSVRVDQSYRGIVMAPDEGNVYMLLWVDKHDDAYQWARNRIVQIHPETGSLQVIPMEEGEVPVSNGESADTGEEEERGEDLFAEHRDRELTRLGVPNELMPLVRSIRTEEQLDDLQQYLPEEAYEALFLLAAGYTQREVDNELAYSRQQEDVDTDDYQAALERPNSQRRFAVVEDDEEMERMLEAPLEKWRVFLHPTQRRLVTMHANGPVRVLGGAGTGKTVVAMHRAVWLAENFFTEASDQLLFTTFTRNLAADIKENLRLIGSPSVLERIEVVNLDAWISRFLGQQDYEYTIDYRGEAEDLWEKALMMAPEGRDRTFLRNEWEQVIQPNGIRSEKGYMRVSRIGRGTPLQRSARAEVWPVFDEYQSLLDEHKLRERPGALRDARRILEDEGDILPYRAILVDEAQDMGKQAFKLIRQMIPGGDQKNDIFIVGDAHQRIYDRQVVLKHCGINIVGRGRKLRVNYRTTEENRQWAVGLLEGAEYDDLDGGTDDQEVYKSLMQGEEPRVEAFDTFQDEAEAIGEYLQQRKNDGQPLRDTCIIARTKSLLDNYSGALRAADLSTYTIQKDRAEDRSASGVRLATMHRAKGLEFERVIIAGVTEGMVPLDKALAGAEDEATRELIRKRERSLLYVSVTRAKREVIVTTHDTPSPWLPGVGG